ncbi:Alpha/beta hydrolase domain-containing protein 13 [Chamberlinius hualienensis]
MDDNSNNQAKPSNPPMVNNNSRKSNGGGEHHELNDQTDERGSGYMRTNSNGNVSVDLTTATQSTTKTADNVKDGNPDFAFIKCVARLVLDIVMRCWAFSATSVLALFLVNFMFGGWLTFLLLIFAVAGILYHAGDVIVYHPEEPANSRLYVPSPQMLGLPFENLFLRTRDGVKINAVLIKQQPAEVMASAHTVLFLHGNAGNIGHRLFNASGLYRHLGCNVFMLEYRGYGKSEGSPSEEGLYLDAQAAMDHLISRGDIDPLKLLVFGRSLGGAVAVNLASHANYSRSVRALLLENTFTNIPDVAQAFINSRLIKFLPTFMYKNKFMSKSKIKTIEVPTLFISGLADRLIPPRMMQELYSLSKSRMKGLITFESGTHNDTWQCHLYYTAVNSFLNKLFAKRESDVPGEEFCIRIPANYT